MLSWRVRASMCVRASVRTSLCVRVFVRALVARAFVYVRARVCVCLRGACSDNEKQKQGRKGNFKKNDI